MDIDIAVARARRREAEKAMRHPDAVPSDGSERGSPEVPSGRDDPDDPQDYGDRGECAVCGRPLDVPPQSEGPQFCDEHDMDDLRALADQFDARRREQEAREADRYRQR